MFDSTYFLKHVCSYRAGVKTKTCGLCGHKVYDQDNKGCYEKELSHKQFFWYKNEQVAKIRIFLFLTYLRRFVKNSIMRIKKYPATGLYVLKKIYFIRYGTALRTNVHLFRSRIGLPFPEF